MLVNHASIIALTSSFLTLPCSLSTLDIARTYLAPNLCLEQIADSLSLVVTCAGDGLEISCLIHECVLILVSTGEVRMHDIGDGDVTTQMLHAATYLVVKIEFLPDHSNGENGDLI